MRKFFNIVSHPILITIILITLYYIGVYNNYFKAIENFKIHLFYLILIAICLGFISGFHFIKKMNKDKYSNYKRIFSEGINEDDSTFLNSNYTDHLIYFVEKNYTHYQMSFIFSIYFFISLLSLYDEIYINENFIAYAFNCYYFVVFLSIFYLKIFDWVLKTEIEEELGSVLYDEYILKHISFYDFFNYKISAISFYMCTLIMILFFILKSNNFI